MPSVRNTMKIIPLLAGCLCLATIASAEDKRVFSPDWKPQFKIKDTENGAGIFNNKSERVGHIRDNRIYDKDWNPAGSLSEGGGDDNDLKGYDWMEDDSTLTSNE